MTALGLVALVVMLIGIQQAGSQSCGTAFATDESTLHFLYSIDKLFVIPVIQQCRDCNFSPNLLDITENDVVQIEIYIGNSYDRRDNIYEPGGTRLGAKKNWCGLYTSSQSGDCVITDRSNVCQKEIQKIATWPPKITSHGCTFDVFITFTVLKCKGSTTANATTIKETSTAAATSEQPQYSTLHQTSSKAAFVKNLKTTSVVVTNITTKYPLPTSEDTTPKTISPMPRSSKISTETWLTITIVLGILLVISNLIIAVLVQKFICQSRYSSDTEIAATVDAEPSTSNTYEMERNSNEYEMEPVSNNEYELATQQTDPIYAVAHHPSTNDQQTTYATARDTPYSGEMISNVLYRQFDENGTD
ncbi:uncharacterized protein LOC143461630 isoform X1 [Clavelina lepadiformis]|uniref:uncharacterized protein LOC143461630 isoform X1 n=1 Tax=Clavelina lepadiformis TaxID=159417 RepID=UPI0040417A93